MGYIWVLDGLYMGYETLKHLLSWMHMQAGKRRELKRKDGGWWMLVPFFDNSGCYLVTLI